MKANENKQVINDSQENTDQNNSNKLDKNNNNNLRLIKELL